METTMMLGQDLTLGTRVVRHNGLVSQHVATVVDRRVIPGGLYMLAFDNGASGGYYHNVSYTVVK